MTPINTEQPPADAVAEALQIVNKNLAHLKISFELVEKIGGDYIDVKDDLDEPLGTPSCNLGEACESCQ